MNPSVGRIVHYVSRGSADGVFAPECRAAVITEVKPWEQMRQRALEQVAKGMDLPEGLVVAVPGLPEVSLCVLNPTGMFFNENIPHDGENAPGTWHWPERVE